MIAYRILIISLLLLVSFEAFSQTITGTGRAATETEALQMAKADAARKALSAVLTDRAQTPEAQEMWRLVNAKAGEWVSDYTLVQRRALENGWSYEISIEAANLFQQISEDPQMIDLVLRFMNRPRVMVLIREGVFGRDGIFGAGQSVESEVAKNLLERNFDVFDRNRVAQIQRRNLLLEMVSSEKIDIEQILNMAVDVGADILIEGDVRYTARPVRELGINAEGYAAVGEITARIYRASDGRLLATNTMLGRRSGPNLDNAVTAAGRESGNLITQYLLKETIRRWTLEMNRGRNVRLVVSEITFPGVRDLRAYLSEMEGISEINFRTFRSGSQEIDLMWSGDVMELAYMLDAIAFPSGVMHVENMDDAVIEIRFAAGETAGTVSQVIASTPARTTVNHSPTALPPFVDIEQNLPRTSAFSPDNIAVIIGNKNYQRAGRGIPDVAYAHRDAQLIRRYLIEVLGFSEGNILYFEDASFSDLASVFGNERVPRGRLANMVKPGISEVFVFYSGHGAPDADTQSGYLVPIDADPNNIRLNGFDTAVLYENLNKTGAKSTTVVLDACFSGGSGDGGMIIQNASPLSIQVQNPAALLENGHIFTASSGDQIASWYPEMQYGIFTYHFLKGLQGAADLNGDGTITVGELHQYLADRTRGVPYKANRLHNRQQHPQLYSVDENRVLLRIERD